MTNPFDQPPQHPQPDEPERGTKRNRTSIYGLDWSSPSRYRLATGLALVILSTIPLGVFTNEQSSDHPALLAIGLPIAIVGFVVAVWPARK